MHLTGMLLFKSRAVSRCLFHLQDISCVLGFLTSLLILFLLQMLCDLKGVKAVFARVLGNVIKTTEPQPEKPKKKKMKKQVTWVEVDE